jgi:hypothetical protein
MSVMAHDGTYLQLLNEIRGSLGNVPQKLKKKLVIKTRDILDC